MAAPLLINPVPALSVRVGEPLAYDFGNHPLFTQLHNTFDGQGQPLTLMVTNDGAAFPNWLTVLPPATPSIIGSVDTPGYAQGVTVSDHLAYVADNNGGLQVIDVTDPRTPQIVGNVTAPCFAQDVTVSGYFAYVADGCGLQVIDVTDPRTLEIVGNVTTPYAALGVTVSGYFAYVADGYGGLQVINVTDPRTPEIVGNVTMNLYAQSVTVSGNFAYVVDLSSGLQIINVRDPKRPRVVGSVAGWSPYAYGSTVSDDLIYVASSSDGLRVIDVTDPGGAEIVGSVGTPGDARDVTVLGHFAYLADRSDGSLKIIDVTDPTTPWIVGSVDTPDEPLAVTTVSNLVYVADSMSGLQIIDVTLSGWQLEGTPSSDDIGDLNLIVSAWPTGGNYSDMATRTFSIQVLPPYTFVSLVNPIPKQTVTIGERLAYDFGNNPLSVQPHDTFNSKGQPLTLSVTNNGEALPDWLALSSPAIALQTIGHSTTPSYAYDVAVLGTLAYVANYDYGLQIINVTNPTQPNIVGSVNTSSAQAVTVSDGLAYVADGASGLQLINLIDPAPHIVSSVDTPGDARGVTVLGNFAYVADGANGLQVVNVTKSTAPYIIGNVPTSSYAYGVTVADNLAYVAGAGGLQIINVTNPTMPQIISNITTTNETYAVTLANGLVYLADGYSGLQIINAAEPTLPDIIGGVRTPGKAYDVAVKGNLAYVADGMSGLQVINVTDPAAPHILYSVNTSDSAVGITLANDLAYVADSTGGLQVIELTSLGWRLEGTPSDTDIGTLNLTIDAWPTDGTPLDKALSSISVVVNAPTQALSQSPTTAAVTDFPTHPSTAKNTIKATTGMLVPSLLHVELTLAAGGTVQVNTEHLLATFGSEVPDDTLLWIISDVQHGQFELRSAPGEAILEFTQEQVNQEAVQFVHDGTGTAPSFRASITQGASASSPINAHIHFAGIPALLVNQLTATVGEQVVLTEQELQADMRHVLPENIVFTMQNITGGYFVRAENSQQKNITQFTQADVVAGDIRFHVGHTEQVPTYSTFVHLLQDPHLTSHLYIAQTSLCIDGNCSPYFPFGASQGLTVLEGGRITVTADNIQARDKEDQAQLWYSITSTPGCGYFLDSRYPEQEIRSFPQSSITGGLIQFQHNGDESDPMANQFFLQAGDGWQESPMLHGTIAVTPVNDAPRVQQLITDYQTNVNEFFILDLPLPAVFTDPDNVFSELSFSAALAHSQFLPQNVTFEARKNNLAGRLSGELTQAGSYGVIVMAKDVQGLNATTQFTLKSVTPLSFVHNGFEIEEGGRVALTLNDIQLQSPENDDEKLSFTVVDQHYGYFSDMNGSVHIKTFNQREIKQGDIQFVHDDGDEAPEYVLSASDGLPGEPIEDSGDVEFTPINDAPEAPPSIEDCIVTVNEAITNCYVQSGTFTDVDNELDELIFSATQANGQALPGGFLFDNSTQRFSGSLTQAGEYDIEVVTADPEGLTAAVRFLLTVNDKETEEADCCWWIPLLIAMGGGIVAITGIVTLCWNLKICCWKNRGSQSKSLETSLESGSSRGSNAESLDNGQSNTESQSGSGQNLNSGSASFSTHPTESVSVELQRFPVESLSDQKETSESNSADSSDAGGASLSRPAEAGSSNEQARAAFNSAAGALRSIRAREDRRAQDSSEHSESFSVSDSSSSHASSSP